MFYVTFFEESNQRTWGLWFPHTPKHRTSVECYTCYNLRKLQRIFASFVIYTQPANALECKLLSADSAIVIRGNPEPHESDGVNIAAFVMRYALVGF